MAQMKITPEHFKLLQDEIAKGELIHCHQDYIERGYTTKRWMWDCVWELPAFKRNNFFASVYQYANDTHIETALRKICKPHMIENAKEYTE